MKRLIGCCAVFCLVALMGGCGGSASSKTLAYVNDSTGTGFTVFSVNTNGTLTDAKLGVQGVGSTKVLVFSPDGQYAYYLDTTGGPCVPNAPDCGAKIYGFRRTGGGVLETQVNGSPYSINEGAASALAISTDTQNMFLYAAVPDAQGGELAVYHIDKSTGELTLQGGANQLTDDNPITQLAMSPQGGLVYGLSPSKGAVVSITLSSANGLPTGIATTPFSSTTISDHGMILSANGKFLYVVDKEKTGLYVDKNGNEGQSPNIYGFATYLATGATIGTLESMAGLGGGAFHENADMTIIPAVFPTEPVGGATSGDSRFLYIANQGSHNISVFKIDATTGALDEVPGSIQNNEGTLTTTQSPFPCGCTTPDSIAVAAANPNFLYVLDPSPGAPAIYQFTNQNTGQLRALTPASVSLAGTSPTSITIR